MSHRARLALFGIGSVALAAVLAAAFLELPDAIGFDHFVSTYYLDEAVRERNSYNVVSAVIFDYRGLDTMIEQLILFASVTGVALLLRPQEREREAEPRDAVAGRSIPAVSDALRMLGMVLPALHLVLALYINLHPHITPGGGFQTGVLFAAGLLGVYLADEYASYDRLTDIDRLEVVEAVAAGGYIVTGLVGLLAVGSFLYNFLPLGSLGELYAAGTIWVLNMIVGLEVAAGFLIVFTRFLDQSFRVREDGKQ